MSKKTIAAIAEFCKMSSVKMASSADFTGRSEHILGNLALLSYLDQKARGLKEMREMKLDHSHKKPNGPNIDMPHIFHETSQVSSEHN